MTDMEELQEMYRALKSRDGKISLNSFKKEYGANQEKRLRSAFGSNHWSKLVESCGDVPRTFATPKVEFSRILDDYGALSRELGKVAVSSDWMFKGLTPSVDGLRNGHGLNFGQLAELFLKDRDGNDAWKDVVGLIRAKHPNLASSSNQVVALNRIIRTSKFAQVLKKIQGWSPGKRYSAEDGYQADLKGYLEATGHTVRYDKGASRPDLLVDSKVAVEVKYAPNLAEYDRLFGQIARHCDDYGELIVVVCNSGPRDVFADFNKRLDKWLRNKAVIEVVNKD